MEMAPLWINQRQYMGIHAAEIPILQDKLQALVIVGDRGGIRIEF